jgi:serine/threonine protein phosphatase 1
LDGISDSVFLGKATTPEGLRLYAIGDIHGCDDMLADVHVRIAADLAGRPVADHRIIHIGDYVDRGPDSAGVIRRLVRLRAENPRMLFLRGNHDERLLAFLDDPSVGDLYLSDNIGGPATLRSYGVTPSRSLLGYDYRRLSQRLAEAMPAEHRAFLEELETTLRFGDYLFVHAGIRPGVPLDMQDLQDLIWIRDEFLFDGRDHGFVVIHGHTPANQPEVRPNRINVDTGAVFGGPLTCLALEGTAHRFL